MSSEDKAIDATWAVRIGVPTVAACAWLVLVPIVAMALTGGGFDWAPVGFIPVALLTAVAWWFHLRDRDARIGNVGATAGWVFIGAIALLGVAAFFWVHVAAGALAGAAAYGIVLILARGRAPRPGRELATGLALIAAGALPVAFTLTVGIGNTDAWWMPAHLLLAVGISLATLLSAVAALPERSPR